MGSTFVCDLDANGNVVCTIGERGSPTVRCINVERLGRKPEDACRAAAKDHFDANLGQTEVQVTVED